MKKIGQSTKPEERSAIGAWAEMAGWGEQHWRRLLAGSLVDSSRSFEELCRHSVPGWGHGHDASGLAWRYAYMPIKWRAWASGLDATRLLELLVGNLSSDDSGVDERYLKERQALRMLCALRVFKEHQVSMADPDPRINSLLRIKLGPWREFPEVAAPGLAREPAWSNGLRDAGVEDVLNVFSQKTLRAVPNRAICLGMLLGVLCAATAAIAMHALVPTGPAAIAAWALGAVAGCNRWTMGWLRRKSCQRACRRALRWLECPPSQGFGQVILRGLSCAAMASGVEEAKRWANAHDRSLEDWNKMDTSLRKKINQARAASAKVSLEQMGRSVAENEREALEADIGQNQEARTKRSSRI
jgi:hypothetical protein